MGFLRKIIDTRVYPTMFGEARCFLQCDSLGNYVRILSLDGTYQSATYLDELWNSPPFAYILAFDSMFQAEGPDLHIEDVLLIGGGGFAYPKHFLTHTQGTSMDVVEIDPKMVEIARRHFYLDRLEEHLDREGQSDRLGIFVQDGLDYLRTCRRSYDVIINDSFEGNDASAAFQQPETIERIHRHLNPSGLYMTNLVVDLTTSGSYRLLEFKSALERVFAHVSIIEATDPEFGGAENYIVVATDGVHSFANTVSFG